jgi:lipopolysaccharide transport system ATP-binding protein
MSDIAIKVENLSKAYLIGLKEQQHESLLSAMMSFVKSPLENFRKIKRLGNLGNTDESDDIFWALKNVNFEVQQGEVIGIIGKNGAGKSTLLKILSQITEPTKGRITITGRVASLLEVGTGFNEELTGRENVYLNGTILGMTKKEIDARYDEIVAFSGVEKFIDTPVKRYSSGMRVRLAFAVAAHLEPEILIIDEVLAVGDTEFQKKCLGKMQDVAGQGRTVLFVSHNMTAIKNLCSRCIILKQGNILFDGKVDDAVHEYLQLNLKETASGIIPEDFPRIANTGEGLFTDVRLMNSEHVEVKDLFYREPFTIEMGFNAKTTIKDPFMCVMICNREGEKISYIESIDTFNKSVPVSTGKHRFSFTITNDLLPGDYVLNLSMSHTFDGKTIDYVEGLVAFEVLKTSKIQNLDYPWARSHGYVRGNATFNIIS